MLVLPFPFAWLFSLGIQFERHGRAIDVKVGYGFLYCGAILYLLNIYLLIIHRIEYLYCKYTSICINIQFLPNKYAFCLFLFLRKDRKSTRLNSSHANISYAVFC